TVRLRIQLDGSAQGRIQLHLLDTVPGTFEMPFGITEARDLKVTEGPRGTEAVLVPVPPVSQPRIRITIPEGTPADIYLSFSFSIAQAYAPPEPSKGKSTPPIRLLKHTFVNTLEMGIGDYHFEVLLPEGSMAQAIREQLPKPSRTEFEPRVRLGRIDGLQSATLGFGPMRQGDDTSLILEITSTHRSWGWLLAGCALALLYLIRFRDLVAHPIQEPGAANIPQP
ncbi:MAG: hypothetical protein WAU15_10235, partial [Nitrosomonas sp.]